VDCTTLGLNPQQVWIVPEFGSSALLMKLACLVRSDTMRGEIATQSDLRFGVLPMFSSPFLPLPAGVEIATTNMRDDLLMVQVVSTKVKSYCPLCFCPAERRHSQYTRLVECIW
jgi:hypothetical protein